MSYYQRAIELDPNFAMGYVTVAEDYSTLSQLERANGYLTKAFQLRQHASEWEKLRITGNYYSSIAGDLNQAAETYREMAESYPRASSPYFSLGYVYGEQGQYEKAAEMTTQAVRLAPDYVAAYENLANFELALQRFDQAQQIVHDAQARKLDDYQLHGAFYALAFDAADSAAMAEQLRWFAARTEYERFGLALSSDTEAYEGHLAKARALTKRAADSAVRADSKETGALWRATAAQREAAYGNATEARQMAAEALMLDRASRGVESEAALALAMAGDTIRAKSLAQDLERRFPLDTQIQSIWLPAIHAELALDAKKPALALNFLQSASSIEFGQIMFANSVSCLYTVYVRGEAYLAVGQGSAAASEFQKLQDHNGIVWNCWTGALAHLGVARANALQARTSRGADSEAARTRALATYKDFLTLWKDADPDIPLLKQAKAEYTKLQ